MDMDIVETVQRRFVYLVQFASCDFTFNSVSRYSVNSIFASYPKTPGLSTALIDYITLFVQNSCKRCTLYAYTRTERYNVFAGRQRILKVLCRQYRGR